MIPASECLRQAKLYLDAADAENRVGMRAALLDLSRTWTAIAEQVERLAIVRQINGLLD
jgi:hypothetical protein